MADHDDIVSRYRDNLRPRYELFAKEVAHRLDMALKHAGISAHHIEPRAKSVESFAEKLLRPGKTYSDAFKEIDDLAGVRVIVYYVSDIERVLGLCRDLFEEHAERSRHMYLEASTFGYESAHMIISTHPDRLHLPEWAPYADLRAEVQVRTVVQHAWASVSHSLQYKQEADVPVALRRRMSRISALLELADTEFSAVQRAHNELRSQLRDDADVRPTDWTAQLDSASLAVFIETSADVAKLTASAIQAGFNLAASDESDARMLLKVMTHAGIETIADVRDALAALADDDVWHNFFHACIDVSASRLWIASPGFLLILVLIWIMRERFDADWLVRELDFSLGVAHEALKAADVAEGRASLA